MRPHSGRRATARPEPRSYWVDAAGNPCLPTETERALRIEVVAVLNDGSVIEETWVPSRLVEPLPEYGCGYGYFYVAPPFGDWHMVPTDRDKASLWARCVRPGEGDRKSMAA